jgi:hypothetical protein
MKRTELAENCYDDIMKLAGSDELKETVKRLSVFLKNREASSFTDISLPNYLWTVKRGGGVSTQINAFSEYLYATRAFDFCGIAKFFEFQLAYMPPNSFFSELTRFDNMLTSYAGRNRRYKGIVCIDVDEWLDHTDENHFQSFLEYVASNNEWVLAVFCIHNENADAADIVETALSAKLRIEALSLRFPDACELVELVESWFMERQGFYLAEGAKALLLKTIAEIAPAKSFNGFKTIAKLADDMLFSILTSDYGDKKEITADMIACYNTDSPYVKRAKARIGMKKAIGFT